MYVRVWRIVGIRKQNIVWGDKIYTHLVSKSLTTYTTVIGRKMWYIQYNYDSKYQRDTSFSSSPSYGTQATYQQSTYWRNGKAAREREKIISMYHRPRQIRIMYFYMILDILMYICMYYTTYEIVCVCVFLKLFVLSVIVVTEKDTVSTVRCSILKMEWGI